jgi:molybdopterin/thiamine biosynthesis adenylyltransferase/rhodanese-related sulfurtransferase
MRKRKATENADRSDGDLPAMSHDEIRRYSRHLTLDEVGVEGQRKLKASRILCIGSGGLGSPTLMYLAAAGVGVLGVVDDDLVDESNLQRQVLHSTSTLGTPKVDSAASRIESLNPHVEVVKHGARLTASNALEIIGAYDLVIDGSDNFPTRYLVNDACVICNRPLVYGAVQKFEGQVSLFNYRGGPNYRDLFPHPPPPGEVPSCAEGGVLGVLPGVIGCLQATEAIKVALGRTEGTLSGRVLIYDALEMRFNQMRLSPRADAPPIRELIDYEGFCSGDSCSVPKPDGAGVGAAGFGCIDVVEAERRMREEGWEPFVLDVRSKAEAAIVSLPFVNLQAAHRGVESIVGALPTDRDILVHCKSGVRSRAACKTLAHLGFARLFSLDGGILGWAKSIDTSLPTY